MAIWRSRCSGQWLTLIAVLGLVGGVLLLLPACTLPFYITPSPTPNATSQALTATPEVVSQALPPIPGLSLAEENNLRQAVERYQVDEAIANLDVAAIQGQDDDWAIIEIRAQSSLPEEDAALFSSEGGVLLARSIGPAENRAWQIAAPGTSAFNTYLDQLPEAYYPTDLKDFWRSPVGALANSDGVYKLPYAGGLTALATCISCYSGHSPAIDFLVLNGQQLVAAADGVVKTVVADNSECCCSSACFRCNNQIVIQHANGERSYYLHFAPNSLADDIQVGAHVAQGQPLARQGDTGYTCGVNGRQESGCPAGKVSPVTGRRCGTHLHFEVRSADGNKVKPRFQDVQEGYGDWYVAQDKRYVSGNNYTPPLTDTMPPETHITNGPVGWIDNSNVALSWGGSDDQTPVSDLAFSLRLDGLSDWSGWASVTHTTYNTRPAGLHTFRVKARDQAGNEDVSPATSTFKLDLDPPAPPSLWLGGFQCQDTHNNTWQNTCSDPAFTWQAYDPGIGVQDYSYYWGPLSDGNPEVWTTAASFDPTAIAATRGYASYYLNVIARDQLGHSSSRATFALRYDGSPPTVSLSISHEANVTRQISVELELAGGDAGSGLANVRFSNDGQVWSDWRPYTQTTGWNLPPLNGTQVSVYAQAQDAAGNLSGPVSDTIRLDLYPPPYPLAIQPTPGPTPIPQADRFGITINNDAACTNQTSVGLQAWAPNVTEVAFSNDGAVYSVWEMAPAWQGATITTTWTLSTAGGQSGIGHVYARFRDTAGAEFGDYFDDIIYDAVAPQGRVSVLGQSGPAVTLELEAWDDYSGIAEIRLAGRQPITPAAWQPYTATMQWLATGSAVYVQFRDRASNVSPVYTSPISIWRVYLPLSLKENQ